MPMYWTAKDVPELGELTPAERRRVHRACYQRHAFGRARWFLASAIMIACVFACAGLFSLAGHFFLGVHFTDWPFLVGLGLGGLIGGLAKAQMLASYLRPFYAQYIQDELRASKA